MALESSAEAEAKIVHEEDAPEEVPQPLTQALLEDAVLRDQSKVSDNEQDGLREENLAVRVCKAEKLDLSGLRLGDVETLETAEALRTLYLHSNMIEKLGSGLMGLRRLQVLSLAHNRLRKIEFGDLSHCENLSLLDLDYNQLQEVPSATVLPRKLRYLTFRHNPCTEAWNDEGIVLFQGATYAEDLPRLRKLNGVMLPLSFRRKKEESKKEESQKEEASVTKEAENDEFPSARAFIKRCVGGKVSTRGDSGDMCYFRMQLSVVVCDFETSASRILAVSFSDADEIWEVASDICSQEKLRVPEDLDILYQAMLDALQRCHRRQMRWDRSRQKVAAAYIAASKGVLGGDEKLEEDKEEPKSDAKVMVEGLEATIDTEEDSGHDLVFVALSKQEGDRYAKAYTKLAEEPPVELRIERGENAEQKQKDAKLEYDQMREKGFAEARKFLSDQQITLREREEITELASPDNDTNTAGESG